MWRTLQMMSAVGLLCAAGAMAQTRGPEIGGGADRADAPAGRRLVGEPIDAGFLMVDGRAVARPYTVAREGDTITINAKVIPAAIETYSRFGGRRGRVREGMGAGRRPGFRGEAARPQWSIEAVLENRLREGSMVVVQQPDFAVVLPLYSAVSLIEVLESNDDLQTKLAAMQKLTPRPIHSSHWRGLIEAYQSSPWVVEEVTVKRAEWDARYPRGETTGRFTDWFIRAAPLVGLFASVLAIGVLIRSGLHTVRAPEESRRWGHVDTSGVRGRVVAQMLVVLLLLNILDLAFTVAAQQTGGFLEANPISRSFISNLGALMLFKLLLCGAAITVLMVLRRRRAAEMAAWWLCLVYTVVLLRWVTVNSVLMA
jgi:hypothetical protein